MPKMKKNISQVDFSKDISALNDNIQDSKESLPLEIKPDITSDLNVKEALEKLLLHVSATSPREAAQIQDDIPLSERTLVVVTIDYVIRIAELLNWGVARSFNRYYIFTGTYWQLITEDNLKAFLGAAAAKIGIDKFLSKHYSFRDNLFKQFYTAAFFEAPEDDSESVKINLANGTFVFDQDKHYLREFKRDDFLKYRLSFPYDPNATAPRFQEFLDRVIPNKEKQLVLAEYIGYIFTKNNFLKLEKALILYGSGANGKSVVHSVILNLFGSENVTNYSLQNLTDSNGYYRAMLNGRLLNYSSEISDRLNPALFKTIISGEPVEVRLPYEKPFIMTDYARSMFNTNVLPKSVENSDGFFRRFLIIHFDQTIPESERDTGLANYIVAHELSGVFNWALNGLQRLLLQGEFTICKAIVDTVEEYKKSSDSVSLFVDDGNYHHDKDNLVPLKEFYRKYRDFCKDSGYSSCSLKTFSERLRKLEFEVTRKSFGRVVHLNVSK